MFFKKKGSLKHTFDQKLLDEMNYFRKQWQYEKDILDRCIDVDADLNFQAKLAEVKYFYLFKEAKERKLKVTNSANK